MQQYTNTFANSLGRPVVGGSVAVYTYPGNVLVVLYSDNGVTPKANPVTTDENGLFEFYAADGRYTLVLTSDTTEDVTLTDAVLLEDPADGSAALAASTGSNLVGHIASGTGAQATTVGAKLRESISVLDKGADSTGVASSLTAFTNAYNDAPAGGRIKIPRGTYLGVSGALTGTKFVIWEAEGQPSGGGIWSLPGMVSQGYTDRQIIAFEQTVADDPKNFSIVRDASHTGGTAGYVAAAAKIVTTVGSGVTNYEWGFLSVLNNNAASGENVAIYGQANKNAAGPTWASVFEAIDKTGVANPSSGLIGAEVDIRGNGTDTSLNRVGVDIFVGKYNAGGAGCVAGNGIRISTLDGTSSYTNGITMLGAIDAGLNIASSGTWGAKFTGTLAVGLDTKDATISTAAMRMARGQKIAFESTSTYVMRADPSVGVIRLDNGSNERVGFDIGGSVGALRINGTNVVGARDTGWSAMTGTANKNTVYDTSTVTLAQLAGRVMSLQAALTTHGMIGA